MRSFTVDDLMRTESFLQRSPWDVTPDGQLLAVSVESPERRQMLAPGSDDFTAGGVYTEANGAQIRVIDAESGEVIEPFVDAAMSWGGRWSPDGSTLAAYVASRDEHVCLALWDRETRSCRLFPDVRTRTGFNFELPEWMPDGRSVVVKLAPSDSPDPVGPVVESFDPENENDNALSVAMIRERRTCGLGVVDATTGDLRELVQGWEFTVFRMAPDGSAVALLRDVEHVELRQGVVADVTVVPMDGTEPRVVASGVPIKGYGCHISWSPDAKTLAYVSSARGEAQRLHLVASDGSHEALSCSTDDFVIGPYQPPLWSPGGSRILWLQNDRIFDSSIRNLELRLFPNDKGYRVITFVQPYTDAVIWRLDRDEMLAIVAHEAADPVLARIDLESGDVEVLCPAPRGTTVFTTTVAGERMFVRERTGSTDAISTCEPKTLHRLNKWLDCVAVASPEVFSFRDVNGREQKASLFLPHDYVAGSPPPMISIVYAGEDNHDEVLDVLEPEVQILVGAGYAVLYPDAVMNDRDPMRQIPGITMPAVNKAVELGYADSERLGVWGHSYGGYTVMSLITQTNAFRAAVASASTVLMTSEYTGSLAGWCETGQGRMGGSPWEHRDTYVENSPFYYLDRVETPVLLVAGERDEPFGGGAREAFVGLKRLGKRVELRTYRRESHWQGAWSAADARDYYERALSWFEEHLKPVAPDA